MTSRRTNRALSTTRRWTAGVLLATTLTAGGLGLHLADAYASSQTGTVAAPTTSGSGTSSTTSSSSSTDTSSSSGFSSTGSVSSSSNSASTTTKGS